jgi:hypothetical protein
VLVKPIGVARYLRFNIWDGTTLGGDAGCMFDLQDVAVGVYRAAGVTESGSGILNYGDGWYLCWFSFPIAVTGSISTHEIGVSNVNDSNFDTSTSVAVDDGFYLWRYQVIPGTQPYSNGDIAFTVAGTSASNVEGSTAGGGSTVSGTASAAGSVATNVVGASTNAQAGSAAGTSTVSGAAQSTSAGTFGAAGTSTASATGDIVGSIASRTFTETGTATTNVVGASTHEATATSIVGDEGVSIRGVGRAIVPLDVTAAGSATTSFIGDVAGPTGSGTASAAGQAGSRLPMRDLSGQVITDISGAPIFAVEISSIEWDSSFLAGATARTVTAAGSATTNGVSPATTSSAAFTVTGTSATTNVVGALTNAQAVNNFYAAPEPKRQRILSTIAPPPQGVGVMGREQELAELDARLGEPGNNRRLVVHGESGVGKSELLREYARRHEARYPAGRYWIDCRLNLASELASLGRQCWQMAWLEGPLEEQALEVLQHLAKEKVLLLFDNATDEEKVQRFLPPAGQAHVLLSSSSPATPRAARVLRRSTSSASSSLAL